MTKNRRRNIRKRLYDGQEGRCHYCKRPMAFNPAKTLQGNFATLDHIVPQSVGGRNSVQNFVLACRRCNEKKKSFSYADFRWALRNGGMSVLQERQVFRRKLKRAAVYAYI